jgi:hypothetical protein
VDKNMLNLLQKTLLIEQSDYQSHMKEAILNNSFWVVAIPCMSGYSIGSFDNDIPALYASKFEVDQENKEMSEEYLQQITEGNRDEDDLWEGHSMEVKFSTVKDRHLDFYSDGHYLHTESVDSTCGF